MVVSRYSPPTLGVPVVGYREAAHCLAPVGEGAPGQLLPHGPIDTKACQVVQSIMSQLRDLDVRRRHVG
jgi:hypothetical protein